ncbi:hypothetical protein LUZ61_011780 [Rhynchospora tenuis]|uniref:Reverse transcriptase domain-containing protein n=1 Tax=Rhynchospora tenuis TaxID=198213 RepID=A0AAD6A1S0_9POAL|nr:hypothetical protein LUZ61_011780 [Rhynchospora tenuis]
MDAEEGTSIQHEEPSDSEQDDEEEKKAEGVDEEHAIITMCTPPSIYHSTLKYKGHIHTIPICALVDSGSTHSFLSPSIAHTLSLKISTITPLSVTIANGQKMVTDKMCKNITFSLQKYEFDADLRLLEVQGYDLILGMDWLSSFGLMSVDWSKGTLYLTHKGVEISLQVEEITAETKICQEEMNIVQENKHGSQIVIAQLFCVQENSTSTPVIQEIGVQQVLDSFTDVFSEPTELPPNRTIDHQIVLKPDSKPVNLRPYRFSYFQKLEIEKIIEELLAKSFIQPSTSCYASPIILVKKKDETWRLCVDYRQLNDNTIKNKFPIPIIEDLLDELKGVQYFSKLDLRSGYHQIRMHQKDIPKTAFRTYEGLYEYKVMPFGLTNAPATFQSLMNIFFKPYLRKFVLVFFDDILIYSKNLQSHLEHLSLALNVLRTNQLSAQLSKCVFAVSQIEYLGYIISKEGVSTDPTKISAMQNWPVPKTVKQLRGFLWLTGYYRKFVKHYGLISKPLTELLKKDAFTWHEAAQQAFDSLKGAMVQAPVLALPDFTKPFTIETNASNLGIGAVLMQDRRPIAFLSKKLGIKAQALSTYEKELLSLLTAVTKWRHYLTGNTFVIRTDQISLKHFVEV